MPFTIGTVKKGLTTKAALEIQSAYQSPVSAFGADSGLWFTEDDFNEQIERSEHQGGRGFIWRAKEDRDPEVALPEEMLSLVATPMNIVPLLRSLGGDFVSNVLTWWPVIKNWVSVGFKDGPAGEVGNVWRMEDAWVQRLALQSEGRGSLLVLARVVAEYVSVPQSNPGASVTIPDVPITGTHRTTWQHGGCRFTRDPGGAAELILLPWRVEVEIDHALDAFVNRQRINEGICWPKIGKTTPTEVSVRLTLQDSTETRKLRDDARAGTWRAARIVWANTTYILTLDFPHLEWSELPRRRVAGGEWAMVQLEGRAFADDFSNNPAVKITKSGF